jgi:hypothetical protein
VRKRTGTITRSPLERRDFLRGATLRHSRTPTEWRMSWQGIRPPKYVHFPIPDLSVPQDSDSLNALLGRIISTGRSAVVHCWGGRGRAPGLVGACFLSLSVAILLPRSRRVVRVWLQTVQAAYDTSSSRADARSLPGALQCSPQVSKSPTGAVLARGRARSDGLLAARTEERNY